MLTTKDIVRRIALAGRTYRGDMESGPARAPGTRDPVAVALVTNLLCSGVSLADCIFVTL